MFQIEKEKKSDGKKIGCILLLLKLHKSCDSKHLQQNKQTTSVIIFFFLKIITKEISFDITTTFDTMFHINIQTNSKFLNIYDLKKRHFTSKKDDYHCI